MPTASNLEYPDRTPGKNPKGRFTSGAKKEIDEMLGERDAEIFNSFYGVEEEGNAPEGSDPRASLPGRIHSFSG